MLNFQSKKITFSKQQKIEDSKIFLELLNTRPINTHHLRFHIKENVVTNPRLGLIVSKKIHKKANKRNYMKRVLRELFRIMLIKIINVDILIRVKAVFLKKDFANIAKEFQKVMLNFYKL